MIWGKGKDSKAKSANGVADSPAPQPKTSSAAAPAPPPPAAKAPAGDGANAKLSGIKARTSAAQTSKFAQLFSQAVAVLMRDPNYKNLPLHELEFLLPPIMTGQCAVANAKAAEDGPYLPVAVALWAHVSPAVDTRLSENLDKPIAMKANEWTSGSIPWLITVAGSPKALPGFVKQLCEKQFKGQKVKMRAADKAGKRSVQILSAEARPSA